MNSNSTPSTGTLPFVLSQLLQDNIEQFLVSFPQLQGFPSSTGSFTSAHNRLQFSPSYTHTHIHAHTHKTMHAHPHPNTAIFLCSPSQENISQSFLNYHLHPSFLFSLQLSLWGFHSHRSTETALVKVIDDLLLTNSTIPFQSSASAVGQQLRPPPCWTS